MNINWTYKPEEFNNNSFAIIPTGDHRVRIGDVVFKTFSSGNEGFEITFDVSGENSKLWFYLVLDHNAPEKTNQRLGAFFDSFDITDYDIGHYQNWKGKIGAVRVKHEDYNGAPTAKAIFCISRKNQNKLPAWKEPGNAKTVSAAASVEIPVDDLPFD